MKIAGIKLVIFDLDGTLIDAYPAIISSFNYTMQKLNYPPQEALVIRRAVGWGDENLLKPFLSPKDLKKALYLYRSHHQRALLKGAHLFPKADEVLNYLWRKGYKLAVASNRPTRFSWILIRHLKLKKYFDYVLCGDTLKYAKPHPGILNKIMRKLKALPEQTLYVGDMAIDAQAGRRAKVRTIIVTTGSSSRAQIRKENPCRIITRLAALLKML
ncbi:MAG: HAD-IA family hydrolase [Candidatus Omnitrophota bacterium]|jgi:phosphoglycolate phosphatase